jgi:hypothetical protein
MGLKATARKQLNRVLARLNSASEGTVKDVLRKIVEKPLRVSKKRQWGVFSGMVEITIYGERLSVSAGKGNYDRRR